MKFSLSKHYHGHRKRLRERFLQSGLAGFSDHEIMEFFLTLSIPVKDVKPLAKRLLMHFKSINGVLDADPQELHTIVGVGPATISSIRFFRSLMEQYLKRTYAHAAWFPSTAETRSFLELSFRGKKVEMFKVIFLILNFISLG